MPKKNYKKKFILSPTYKLRFAYLNQTKIGSKKWINELIYGKYRDASDDDDSNLDDDDDDGFEGVPPNSDPSSSETHSDEEGFERIPNPEEDMAKNRRNKQRKSCETNTQNECFILAINPGQKYFVLFDSNGQDEDEESTRSSLARSLGLASDEEYSVEMEASIMKSLANWLDKITEGLTPNKHVIRDWPIFN